MHSKKYWTPLGSVAVVAVMVIDVWPSAEGGDAKVIGSGLGAVVSGEAVVAEAGGRRRGFVERGVAGLHGVAVGGARGEARGGETVALCQPLSGPPPAVHSKKYSTPLGSVAVVAVMVIEVSPSALGGTAKLIGSGLGAVRSGGAVVKLQVLSLRMPAVAVEREIVDGGGGDLDGISLAKRRGSPRVDGQERCQKPRLGSVSVTGITMSPPEPSVRLRSVMSPVPMAMDSLKVATRFAC